MESLRNERSSASATLEFDRGVVNGRLYYGFEADEGYCDDGHGSTIPSFAFRPAGGVGMPRFPVVW